MHIRFNLKYTVVQLTASGQDEGNTACFGLKTMPEGRNGAGLLYNCQTNANIFSFLEEERH